MMNHHTRYWYGGTVLFGVVQLALLGGCLDQRHLIGETPPPGTGGTHGGTGGAVGAGGGSPGGTAGAGGGPTIVFSGAPCDIYETAGTPCVAAHSTARALYSDYGGPLYQVRRADGVTLDIGPVGLGGLASAADQDAFCGTAGCTISLIYDQTLHGNHLTKAPPGQAKATPGNEADANGAPIMLGGNKVYGVSIVAGVGYRNDTPKGTATGDAPETEYMVVAGSVYNGGCCMDYGNMETTNNDDGEGSVEAIYFGSCTIWGKGAGAGPWVMADLENGLWAGNLTPYAGNPSIAGWPFVTGMVKGGPAGANRWTIKEGNAAAGTLITAFDGARPSALYNPMRKQGGIGLGIGGDNSNAARANWFEGVMTTGYASDAADDAVQANIVSVYGPQ